MSKKTDKKNNKKKLKSLILLLFLTVVMLSTATYAWFTSNKTVTIDDINVNVATSSGIQISTNAEAWKTLITNSDITTGYTGAVNMLPQELAPVSTAGIIEQSSTPLENRLTSVGFMQMFYGEVKSDEGTFALQASKDVESNGSTGHFIAFDVFLKVEKETPVYFEPSTGVTTTDSYTSKGLLYASRIAFIDEGTVASDAGASAAQALNGGTTPVILEPNYDGHTTSGVTNASQYYNITTSAATSGVAKVSYDGVKAEIPETARIPLINTNATSNSSKFATVTTVDIPYDYSNGTLPESKEYIEAFTLQPGVTKVRIYMWIEGQDIDCENNASGDHLTYRVILSTDCGAADAACMAEAGD